MPTTVYRGSRSFYFEKKLTFGIIAIVAVGVTFGLVIVLPVLLHELILRWDDILREGTIVNSLTNPAFLCLAIGMVVWVLLIFSNMYLEIGTSSDALWYRNWFRWRAIPWEHVSEVKIAKPPFAPKLGLLVYSKRLPMYHRDYGRIFGRSKGKALLITHQLIGFDRLSAEIRQHKQIRG